MSGGNVYLSDLAQMGEDLAAQIAQLENSAKALDAQAAQFDNLALASASNPTTYQNYKNQAGAARASAQAARDKANQLRSQQATSGGVSSSDLMNLFGKITEAGAGVASTVLLTQAQKDAAKRALQTGNTQGLDPATLAYLQSQQPRSGIGLLEALGIGAAAAALIGGTVYFATRNAAPQQARANRGRRRNCGAGCDCAACGGARANRGRGRRRNPEECVSCGEDLNDGETDVVCEVCRSLGD